MIRGSLFNDAREEWVVHKLRETHQGIFIRLKKVSLSFLNTQCSDYDVRSVVNERLISDKGNCFFGLDRDERAAGHSPQTARFRGGTILCTGFGFRHFPN
jgi:hypothetical protein